MRFSGNDGDDYLVLGVRSGRVVHRFNLGSGVATMVSDPLDLRVNIHSVRFGRTGRTGWLKVSQSSVEPSLFSSPYKDQKCRTVAFLGSPGDSSQASDSPLNQRKKKFHLTADAVASKNPPEQMQLSYSALKFFLSDPRLIPLLPLSEKSVFNCFHLFMLAFMVSLYLL